MTLELSRLTRAVREMGQALAGRERAFGQLVLQARAWLAEFADRGTELARAAKEAGAAIPTDEPLDFVGVLPDVPERFTAIGTDGSQVEPDRHGIALYYLLNVGGLVYRHGSGQTPEACSVPRLYHRDADLYDGGLQVAGNLLDVRRTQAEVQHLADLVEAEPAGPTLALMDGSLLLWILENLPSETRREKVQAYLGQVDRIHEKGDVALVGFVSRPRADEVGRLLHLARLDGDVQAARTEPNPLGHLPDRAVFSFLPPGARSALFASTCGVDRKLYESGRNAVCFFYVNVAAEGEDVAIDRVEVPTWVTERPELLALAHGGVVAQCRIAGGFPYVLARADELAYISGPEREQLNEMVAAALLAEGLRPDLSSKAQYKRMTRRGRAW